MQEYYLGETLTPNAPTDQWLVESNLDFTVNESPVFYRDGNQAQVSKDHKVLFQSNDPANIFGVVSDQFKPVQPVDLMQFYKELEQETGFAVKAAGILKKKRIFVTAKNERQYEVGGHPVKNYLIGSTENGGGSSTIISPTNVRPICENTLQMALSEALKMSITHRTKINWEMVKKWVTQENESFDLYGELMNAMFNVTITASNAASFAHSILAPEWNPKEKETAPRAYTQFADTLAKGKGQAEAMSQDGYNAYWLMNGFTRYLDHEKPARSEDNRQDNALFGAGASLKNQILNQLIKDCSEKFGDPEPKKIQKEIVQVSKQAVYA